MRRVALTLLAAFFLCAFAAPPANADFGLNGLSVTPKNAKGAVEVQAGSHPDVFTVKLEANTEIVPGPFEVPADSIKDLTIALPPGLVGSPEAVPQCPAAKFIEKPKAGQEIYGCPDSSVVGFANVELTLNQDRPSGAVGAIVYNLIPPPGVAAKIGFTVVGVPVVVETILNPNPPYNVITRSTNTSQAGRFYSAEVNLWGNPADPVHDDERGTCLGAKEDCEVGLPNRPFLTLPRSCDGPLQTLFEANSWQDPSVTLSYPVQSTGMEECGKLGFSPEIDAKPTSRAAQSPSGLDFNLTVNNEGLTNPAGIADADISKVVATLPEGMSANPSLAEGLGVCTQAQLARETPTSEPGDGCPNASKIGTAEVETPLLEEKVYGSLYIAKPYENPFGSLLAMYLVLQNKQLGISVKQPLKIVPDPKTGRLTTIAEDLPQLPFSSFKLHFREGTRSPLATPSSCDGDPTKPGNQPHTVNALLYPSSGGAPVPASSSFQIISGPDGGPCPSGGLPPFKPGLLAGTINNAAGRYSPFNVRMSRSDAEQEITHFSIKLPPGIVGKLAGIPFCPESAIAQAEARTGAQGGHEELANPSCPAASQVGRSLVGAGVGPALAYAPGKVYLAGPYHGSALSIAAVTAGVVGPFDIGTVVVREGLKINPETAEVFIDATGSDPIPHIIKGIPVHLRDIRAYVDRPDFVINPTSCARTSTASTLLGSGLDFVSEADDNPITVSSPFQAADCAALGFKPKLSLQLIGATKRGGHPALRAVLAPRPGDANTSRASVQLPHSAFLDQSHIRTVCTRVQFKAGAGNGSQCPAGSIYGHARAFSPILADPLEGPVILRSSEHPLPDLVLAVSGLIDFNAIGRIDSVKGGIRSTFDFVPDAPITKVVLNMQGAKKGLLENSTNLCKATQRATVKLSAHNGRRANSRPVVKTQCKKAKEHKRHRSARAR